VPFTEMIESSIPCMYAALVKPTLSMSVVFWRGTVNYSSPLKKENLSY